MGSICSSLVSNPQSVDDDRNDIDTIDTSPAPIIRAIPPFFAMGASISSDEIYKIIIQNVIDENIEMKTIFPEELIIECMKYIGFFMDSNILNPSEQISLYQLLLKHYKNEEIISPLTNTNCMRYFDLVYSSSVNGNKGRYSNETLLNAIQNKENMIIVYHTNYNHVFAIYLHQPLIKNDRGEFYGMIEDNDICLFLLRSQFVYESNKKCPRIISGPEQCGLLYYDAMHYLYLFKNSITIFGLTFDSNGYNHHLVPWNEMDMDGNEICGGLHAKLDTQCTHFNYFQLNEVEAYQLL